MSEYPPGRKKGKRAKENKDHSGMDEVRDLLKRVSHSAESVSPATASAAETAPAPEIAPTAEAKSETSAQERSDFDVAKQARIAEKIYRDLGQEVRDMGVKPEDMPASAWKIFNAAFESIKRLSKAYEVEEDGARRKTLEVSIQKLQLTLNGKGRMEVLAAAAQSVIKHEKEIGKTKEKRAEIAPNERQQNKLLKLALTDGGGVDILIGPETTISPEERAKAMELLSDPDVRKRLDDSIAKLIPLSKGVEYHTQLGLLRKEAETPGLDLSGPEATPLDLYLSEPATEGAPLTTEPLPAVFRSNRKARGAETQIPTLENAVSDGTKGEERTPKEERQILRKLVGLIEGTKSMAEGASERFTRSKEFLNARAKEMDAKAAEMGGVEKWFRKLGKNYDKLSMLHKLGVGVTLGVGAAVSAGSAPFLALGFMGALGAQRVYGMASMFVKIEKDLQEKKIGETSAQFIGRKERAFVDAALYTVAMGAAIQETIKYASETETVQTIQRWLGGMLGHEAPATVSSGPEATPVTTKVPQAAAPEVPQSIEAPTSATSGLTDAQVRHAGESAVQETPSAAFEAPTVGASVRGYEGMLKDLLKQLPDTKPENIPDGSDLAKLYEAKASGDPREIGNTIHRIALDHKFFERGASARIVVGDQMTVDAKTGNILFNGEVQAPTGVKMIPEYQPEAPTTSAETAPAPSGIRETIEPIGRDYGPEVQPEGAEQPSAPVEAPSPAVETPATSLPTENVPAQEAIPTVDLTQGSVIQNSFGLSIPTNEAHIYADAGAQHMLVYGGSPQEKMRVILEYLTKNPDKIVFSTDDNNQYRIPLRLVGGELVPGDPVRTSGFLDFFSTFMGAPTPEELEKLIK